MPSGLLERWKLRQQEFDFEWYTRWTLSPGHRGSDESELGNDIPVMDLTKADDETLDTFNGENPLSH